jgi:hypothetical protein
MKLTIELVPKTCWFSNVRDHVSHAQWDMLRKQTYKEAGYVCEICGGRGEKHPVECHEVWTYDDINHVQTLTRLIALCPACHEVKHIGLASVRGRGQIALAHMARVNGIGLSEAMNYYVDAFEKWEDRSKHEWSLDLSWLEKAGIVVTPKR